MPAIDGNMTMIIYVVALMAIMYFLIFLPQRKREKKQQQLLGSIVTGNEIVTIGGIVGKVINIKDDVLTIETGAEKTKLRIKKWAVKEVVKPVES